MDSELISIELFFLVNFAPKLLRISAMTLMSVSCGTFLMRSLSFVSRPAAIKTSEEFFAPLTFKIPLSGHPPFTSRCGGIKCLLIVATLLILERTAYLAIMPSGFKIVQSTLLKIDGFKLNIDNVDSLNNIYRCFLLFLTNIIGYFKANTISPFSKNQII